MPVMHHEDGRKRVVPDHCVGAYESVGWTKSRQTEPPTMSVPNPADLKAGWVEYAVSQGMDRLEAQSMTKAELKAKYLV